MSNPAGDIQPLIGRILISLVFLFSGTFKIAQYSQFVGFAGAKGIPLPAFSIVCAAAVELLGGLAIVAWLWILYLIPTTLVFHNFWAMKGMEQEDNMVHFLLNLAVMGGLLYVAEFGAGRYSLDARGAAKT